MKTIRALCLVISTAVGVAAIIGCAGTATAPTYSTPTKYRLLRDSQSSTYDPKMGGVQAVSTMSEKGLVLEIHDSMEKCQAELTKKKNDKPKAGVTYHYYCEAGR